MDNIQAIIEADEQLAARVQAEEKELYSIEEKSRLLEEMIAERKRFFAAQRAAKQRSKPPTKTQMRNIIFQSNHIVDWKIHILSEDKMYYEIIRANGSTKSYKIFTEMLDDFDRQDGVLIYERLVKERFETTQNQKDMIDYFREIPYCSLETKNAEWEARGTIMIDSSKALDADLVITESSGTESEVQDDSSKSGNDTDTDDADIRPIYYEEPLAEVQLTAECNIFAIGQQHTEQPEIINEGRVDQYPEQWQVKSPMLDSSLDNQTTEYSTQSLEFENILLKKIVAQFQKDFSRIEAHCIALELKYQNQAFKSEQHGQILIETKLISKTIEQTNSLLANNADLKAQIQEKEKTKKRDRNSKTNVIPSARFQSTVDGSKPKPKSTNHSTRSLPVSKSSCVTITAIPKADHSKSSSSFSDSKHFVCSTCNNPVDFKKSHTQNPVERSLPEWYSSPPNKTFRCMRKHLLDLDLEVETTGTSINVQKEQSLDLSADHVSSDPGPQCSTTVLEQDSLSPGLQSQENVPQIAETVTTSNELDLLYSPMFSELLNGTSPVVLKYSAVTTTDASNKRQQPDSTSSTSTLATTVTANGNFDL
ncbi:hypothetical protein Tco_0092122 [Tanacetum coccineum]